MIIKQSTLFRWRLGERKHYTGILRENKEQKQRKKKIEKERETDH